MPMKSYASYAEWKKDQSPRNRRLIAALERLIEEAAPEWTKAVKWGQGCFEENGVHKAYLHTEEDHVQLGFYAGSTLRDPQGLLVGNGKHVRHVKVRTARDLDADAFAAYIDQVKGPG
jgi:hypothetical protein